MPKQNNNFFNIFQVGPKQQFCSPTPTILPRLTLSFISSCQGVKTGADLMAAARRGGWIWRAKSWGRQQVARMDPADCSNLFKLWSRLFIFTRYTRLSQEFEQADWTVEGPWLVPLPRSQWLDDTRFSLGPGIPVACSWSHIGVAMHCAWTWKTGSGNGNQHFERTWPCALHCFTFNLWNWHSLQIQILHADDIPKHLHFYEPVGTTTAICYSKSI